MSNSTMNEINIINPTIYRLYFNNFMASFDIETKTKSSSLIDMSNKSENNISIISSETIYSTFKKCVIDRTNNNVCAIRFYSLCGGKEITRMLTNSTNMSMLPYPPYSGTLFSSIILPEFNYNEIVYLILDECKEIKTVTCPLIKTNLIKRDLTLLFENIKLSTEGKNIKFTIIYEKSLYEELSKSYTEINSLMDEYNISFNYDFRTPNIICNYVCDLVFGKIFGGKTHEFTGIINPESFIIIDMFCSNTNHVHTFTNRTSGLSISGKGISRINILMKSNSEDIADLLITEIVTGKELLKVNLLENVKVHQNTKILLDLIGFHNYNLQLNNILIEDSTKIKEFLKKNIYLNFDLEFNFFDNYDERELQEDIRIPVHTSIMILYNRIILTLDNIRKMFINKTNSNFDDDIPYIQRGHTVLSTPGLPSKDNNECIPKLRRFNAQLELKDPFTGRLSSTALPNSNW